MERHKPRIDSFGIGVVIDGVSFTQRLLDALQAVFGNCWYSATDIQYSTSAEWDCHHSKVNPLQQHAKFQLKL